MATFRLKEKCGNHIGPPDAKGYRKTYKAGDKVQSDDDLVEKYPSKFVLVSSDERKSAVAKAPNIPKPSTKKEKVSEKKSQQKVYEDMEEPMIPDSEHGIDVSAEFPTASKVSLKVFEKSKWFIVVDPDNNEVLNEKKLRRAKVESFLAEYLQDDEEDKDEATDTKVKDKDKDEEPIIEDADDEDEYEDDEDDEDDEDEDE